MENSASISPEETDLIERYLLHQMSAEEEAVFENSMNGDPALKEKVNEMRLLILGINEVMLESKLDTFHSASMPAELKTIPSAKIFPFRKWLVAASVILIAGLGVYYFALRPSLEEQLFDTYYSADPGLITAMGTAEEGYAFQKAMVDYKSGDVWNAAQVWQQLLTEHPQSDTLNYFLASAWLKLDKPKDAIPLLEKVTAMPGSVFLNDAYWYIGLSFLSTGKTEYAIAYIRKAEHPQKEALLQQLEKMPVR